ncbi:MAG TPA: PASTA domain-containing protein [Capillimicrobium sp.]|nr:PASTA domain-containing protein [Capillimicrobium sp.]
MVRDIPAGTMVDGRYRIIERVGSGGMADVYCAEDTQLGRNVALKLLHRRFAEDREFVERFRREASSAAGLSHPNVVGVFDRGEWDGTSYIAMEFLGGRTLKQVIVEEAPLDPVRAIDLTAQILRAARFAHKRGIIHRDLKPHNVIVDAEGRAKVTDFGIARAGASDMTQTGSIMGTAQYLSPEQAQGHAVTPQSDLYSIGIVLYEMLTGRLPFDGESAVTIALKQVNEAPIPPSAFNGAVTPELEGIVLHALEKDPARRFADADEFLNALERARANIVAGAPESMTAAFAPVGVGPGDDLPPEEERGSRRAWWIAAIVVLLLAGGAVLAYALTRPDERTVPDVTGKPLAAALAILQDAGFDPSVERIESDAEPGTVVRQDPQPGERAEEGSEVTLTVSQGPGTRAVPDVVGQPVRAAVRALEDAGFETRQRRESSDDVPRGRVISTTPEPGTPAEVGSRVTLVVSSGPEQVEVPTVVGLSRDEARDTLEAAGFVVRTEQQEDENAEEDTVLSQDPAAGTQLARGETVTVTVAVEPRTVRVPDVTGLPVDEAVNALADAGLVPNQVSETVTDEDDDGVVLDQRPAPGRTVDRNSRVTVTVGAYEPPSTDTQPTPPPSTEPSPSTTTPSDSAAIVPPPSTP